MLDGLPAEEVSCFFAGSFAIGLSELIHLRPPWYAGENNPPTTWPAASPRKEHPAMFTRARTSRFFIVALAMALPLLFFAAGVSPHPLYADAPADEQSQELRSHLDAPLLFTKRHSYTGIHIYDTFYKWPPGGGGIYVLENPAAPRDQWNIRPVIDPTTPETLGVGVYTHPELSWDATKLLFCFKGEPRGSTAIYEIGVDGRGLRQVTDPTVACDDYHGGHAGQHDIAPAYLPDGRIVFLSTRPSGLVPCANSGVSILHVMNADGSDIHPISVNHVNEFDPSVLPDGKVLFGRWEYVDKNALTIQSLWAMNPDGTQETAVFANNMVFPEAVLDARNVPGTNLILGTLAKHNSTPRGSIALIDPRRGKNHTAAIENLEHPDNPTYDRGDSCQPWPVTPDVIVFSGRPAGSQRNVLELIDRNGRREVLLSDPEICLHAPMLIKPRPRPPAISDTVDRTQTTGRFFLQDVYTGMPEVKRGEVKYLRVIEETSRVSPTLMGGNPYNQVSLVSAALAFNVKNFLGIVPVAEDGSAYFEVPSGRGVFFHALDAEGRVIRSMRSFVQAAPGTTRSCIGCHEHKYDAAGNHGLRDLFGRKPDQIQPESWGSGYVDYPSMVQPILDRRCVRCHGGEEGIAAGMDLSGGWTEHFNISYENLANRLETQLTAYWIAGIDCMNGTALWSSQIFPPRGHGSGAAPLAKLLVEGHDGHIPDLTREERDLILAWIDTNGLYHGHWDATTAGCGIRQWNNIKGPLIAEMHKAGCLECHGNGNQISYFENDWINLREPGLSRILRAPLAEGDEGLGLARCRDRQVNPDRQRIRLLVKGYAHAVQPPEAFPKRTYEPYDPSGQAVTRFASVDDPRYQAMLKIIRDARVEVLANPRIDMPGAQVVAGSCRMFIPPPVPATAPPLGSMLMADGVVQLAWQRSSETIGLAFELHRSEQVDFAPCEGTRLTRTFLGQFVDCEPPEGNHVYALVVASEDGETSAPSYTRIDVPPPPPPPVPLGLRTLPSSAAVRLRWEIPRTPVAGYHVYRGTVGERPAERITTEPTTRIEYSDSTAQTDTTYSYAVRAVSSRGIESELSATVEATAKIIREPMFVARLAEDTRALLYGGDAVPGKLHGPAKITDASLDVRKGGHVTFPHHAFFDLGQPLTVECTVWFDKQGTMPVFVSCGHWNQAGWFLQWLGNRWRWHVGGVDCDGGQPATGRWIHLVGIYDGEKLCLYQDGKKVAECPANPNTAPFPRGLYIGQYSGTPSADFQLHGRIGGVKLYHRALTPEEILKAAQLKPK